MSSNRYSTHVRVLEKQEDSESLGTPGNARLHLEHVCSESRSGGWGGCLGAPACVTSPL